MITIEDRREIVDQFRSIEERLERAPHLVVHGSVLSSEGALAAFLRSAADGALPEIRRQLAELEATAQEHAARRAADAESEEQRRRDAERPDPMAAHYDALADSARRAAEYRASTNGQLEELIKINTRILEALERRG